MTQSQNNAIRWLGLTVAVNIVFLVVIFGWALGRTNVRDTQMAGLSHLIETHMIEHRCTASEEFNVLREAHDLPPLPPTRMCLDRGSD